MLVGIGLCRWMGRPGGCRRRRSADLWSCGFPVRGTHHRGGAMPEERRTLCMILPEFAFCRLYAAVAQPDLSKRQHADDVQPQLRRRAAVSRCCSTTINAKPAQTSQPEHGARLACGDSAVAGIGVRRAVFLPAAGGRKVTPQMGVRLCGDLRGAAATGELAPEGRMIKAAKATDWGVMYTPIVFCMLFVCVPCALSAAVNCFRSGRTGSNSSPRRKSALTAK